MRTMLQWLHETRSFPEGSFCISALAFLEEFHHSLGVWLLVASQKAIAIVDILVVRHFSPLLTPGQKTRALWKVRFYKRLLYRGGLSWHSSFAHFLSHLPFSLCNRATPSLAQCQGCISFLFFPLLFFFTR